MCALQTGSSPVRDYRAFIARAAVAAILAAIGGCATNQTQTTAGYEPVARVAQAAVDVEDDGLPAQTPPLATIRHLPDDPAEPYSRNYGGDNPSASVAPGPHEQMPKRAPQPDVPNDLPPAFRQKLVAALAQDE